MKISKIVAAVGLLAAASASAQESKEVQGVLSPEQNLIEGVSYGRAFEIIEQQGYVEYGEPIQLTIDKTNGTVDLSDFNGDFVTVPLDQALSQPNRTEPSGGPL